MAKNIGVDVPEPKEKCEDRHCPFHGELKLRGSLFVGTVVASKVKKTATVEKTWRHYIPKYERFEERRSRLRVHNPLCIDAKEGDRVKVMESRPISKTKKFVIIQNLAVVEQK
ncbi:30S ribosomal protein S17 [Candidatus Woesearchaeota archaeon]|nr:30S ribosomal protein S17 [Candidatus Woesearchaeota archaeon]MBW3017419.1 30S ribosomal protein S17 [Candidatus Woesearchaeota archaeon]